MKKCTYFDYAATTPVDPTVLQTMLPYFSDEFGNPSSIHRWGQRAEAVLEKARVICAKLLNITPENVVFTSGGTESDNLALRGSALFQRKAIGADEVLITHVEHHAISHTARQLEAEFGFKLRFLPVNKYGMVDPSDVKKLISSKTALVSIIYGNNEVGTVNPIAEIGIICREMDIPFHSDAVQAAAHITMDMVRDNLTMLSIGAHKMYGPKGVGLLGINVSKGLIPAQTGGGQEFNLRAGTQNIPLIVGMSKAFELSQTEIGNRNKNLICLRDQLIAGVLDRIPDSFLTGHPEIRLPNHASFVFSSVDGNRLLMYLDSQGFACSSGSACKVGSPKPSNVLTSMGIKPELAIGSLRVTIGKETTEDQINDLTMAIESSVRLLRK